MNIARFSVQNSVLVNLAVVLLAGTGIFAYTFLPREIFPQFSLNTVRITTLYPGASPEEIEELITSKIERQIRNLDGIDEMESTSIEGSSTILVKLRKEVDDIGRFIDEVESEIDQIDDLPEEAEDPIVRELENRFPVIMASLFGDLPEGTMKDIAEDVADDLRDIPGVSQVIPLGTREREIWVELDREALLAYDLSVAEVEAVLAQRNVSIPAGTIETPNGEIIVRGIGKFDTADEIRDIVVRPGDPGQALTLGRIAHVREAFEDPARSASRFMGKRTVNLVVFKGASGDAIDIADAVKAYCAEARQRLPAGLDLGTHTDLSVYIVNRLNTMKSSGLFGLVLVLVCLCLFLNFRIAIMTALGIPVSFLGAALLMQMSGITMNMISMFAFIVVLGMVVDDAIIICENIYRHLEMGKSPREAAITGAAEVLGPVVCTVTTTIAAFLPMLLVSGMIGEFIAVIPKVVTFALAVSLFEALIALPSHVAEFTPAGLISADSPSLGETLLRPVRALYATVMPRVLANRYPMVAFSFGATAVLATAAFTRIPFVLFGDFQADQFWIIAKVPPGSSIGHTEAAVEQIEAKVAALPKDELLSFNSNVGVIFYDNNRFESGSNIAQVYVDLKASKPRPSQVIINDLRDRLGEIEGLESLEIASPQAGPAAPAIEVAVEGDDFEELQRVANEMQEFLARLPGVQDIRDDFEPGKEEWYVRLRPEGRSLGLTAAEIAAQLRGRILGAEATVMPTREEDVEVLVRQPKPERSLVSDVAALRFNLPAGGTVPLSTVAELERRQGKARIVHADRHRAITVMADVDPARANSREATKALLAAFTPKADAARSWRLNVKGEYKDTEESIGQLAEAMWIAIGLIYLLLAAQFRSYLQPLVIMTAIPLGVTGVIVGHLVMGTPLTFLSAVGLVALMGIVVNDSLVLVEFINKRRGAGIAREEAIIEAGRLRMRPIFLTTITTVAGLLPLAYFATGQAKFLAPMAQAIVWGLTLATGLTLVVVPCVYAVYDDLRQAGGRFWKRLRR
ncbi:MAG: efflux RND transporter permease subunit [Planctomycetota bacterium]